MTKQFRTLLFVFGLLSGSIMSVATWGNEPKILILAPVVFGFGIILVLCADPTDDELRKELRRREHESEKRAVLKALRERQDLEDGPAQ